MDNNKQIIEIIVGTYEEFLIGYKLTYNEGVYALDQSFTNHAHTSSIRCLSSCGKFIASGGVDEAVRIFNMKKRKDVGTLVQHDGTIAHVEFYENNHLFTSSEDSSICIWNTKSWECEKTLKGHKDAVNSISVHPSGKLLLSVSKDKTLRTWNLIKGRCAYVTNLKSISHLVVWSKKGTHFAVAIDKRVDIYDISVAGVVYAIDFGHRVNCFTFLNNTTIVIGGDSESIQIIDIEKKSLLNSFKAHDNRLKSLQCVSNINYLIETNKIWLVSCSSDGFIKIWEFDSNNLANNPVMIASIDTTCRLTCLTAWIPSKDQSNVQSNELKQISGNTQDDKVKKRKKKFKESQNKKLS